jgi:hypothetical protein
MVTDKNIEKLGKLEGEEIRTKYAQTTLKSVNMMKSYRESERQTF